MFCWKYKKNTNLNLLNAYVFIWNPDRPHSVHYHTLEFWMKRWHDGTMTMMRWRWRDGAMIMTRWRWCDDVIVRYSDDMMVIRGWWWSDLYRHPYHDIASSPQISSVWWCDSELRGSIQIPYIIHKLKFNEQIFIKSFKRNPKQLFYWRKYIMDSSNQTIVKTNHLSRFLF